MIDTSCDVTGRVAVVVDDDSNVRLIGAPR